MKKCILCKVYNSILIIACFMSCFGIYCKATLKMLDNINDIAVIALFTTGVVIAIVTSFLLHCLMEKLLKHLQ